MKKFADRLEGAAHFQNAIHELIAETIRDHKRILFNGNGYDQAWVKEAETRGLLNLASSAEALPTFVAQKNIDLFVRHKVFTETEMRSRCEIMLENYGKLVSIEAETMLEMIHKDIVPACYTYLKRLAETGLSLQSLCPGLDCSGTKAMAAELCSLVDSLQSKAAALEQAVSAVRPDDAREAALYVRHTLIPAMEAARGVADTLESRIGEKILALSHLRRFAVRRITQRRGVIMSKIVIPAGYKPALDLYQTQTAIGTAKRLFEDHLSGALNLRRVSARVRSAFSPKAGPEAYG